MANVLMFMYFYCCCQWNLTLRDLFTNGRSRSVKKCRHSITCAVFFATD